MAGTLPVQMVEWQLPRKSRYPARVHRAPAHSNCSAAELGLDLGLHLISIQGWIARRVAAPLGFMQAMRGINVCLS